MSYVPRMSSVEDWTCQHCYRQTHVLTITKSTIDGVACQKRVNSSADVAITHVDPMTHRAITSDQRFLSALSYMHLRLGGAWMGHLEARNDSLYEVQETIRMARASTSAEREGVALAPRYAKVLHISITRPRNTGTEDANGWSLFV